MNGLLQTIAVYFECSVVLKDECMLTLTLHNANKNLLSCVFHRPFLHELPNCRHFCLGEQHVKLLSIHRSPSGIIRKRGRDARHR